MANSAFAILGTGSFAPAKVLTNEELSSLVDTSDEWIVTRTGIKERHIAGPEEKTSTMAMAAAKAALENAGIDAQQIDLIIVATATPDQPMPATACLVQAALGISNRAAAFDINAACSGFIYALDTAWGMLQSGRYHHALVIGAEKFSSVVDWKDRTTCVLFGDGAGAVVLGPAKDETSRLIDAQLYAEGIHSELLCIPGGGSNGNDAPKTVQMKGREVFKNAVREMEDSARDILERNHIPPESINCVIPHQANLRIIDAIAQYLHLPKDRFFINLERYGNTSAASIPIALDEAHRSGHLKRGELLLLVAFGAGLTYGATLLRF